MSNLPKKGEETRQFQKVDKSGQSLFDHPLDRLLLVEALAAAALFFVFTFASLFLSYQPYQPDQTYPIQNQSVNNETQVLGQSTDESSGSFLGNIAKTIFKPFGSFTLWLLKLNTSEANALDPLAVTDVNSTFVLDDAGNVVVTKPLILQGGGRLDKVDWDSLEGKPTLLSTVNEVEGASGNLKLVEGNNIDIANDKEANSITISSTLAGTSLSSSDVSLTAGTGISITGSSPSFAVTNTNLGSSQNIFKNVGVASQPTIAADSNNDTLTFVAGSNIAITTNATNDTLTLAVSGSVANADTLDTLDSLQFLRSDTSDSFTSGTLTIAAGTTLSITGSFSCTNCVGDTAVVDTITIGAGGSVAAAAITGSLTDAQIADTLTISAGSVTAGVISGSLTDAQISNTLTVDGTGSINAGAINSGTLGNAGVTLAFGSFGSITGSLGDANVADTITASNYLPLAGGAMTGALTFSGTIGTAIDASDTNITNAMNVGDNVISGTTASIDFTDFDVSTDGHITLRPDVIFPSANYLDIIAPSTFTAGSTTINVYGISSAGDLNTVIDGSGETIDWRAVNLTLPAINSAQEAADVINRVGILITAGAITAGAGTETSVGIDVSDADIVTALSVGANTITGTTATIDFTNFDVSSTGAITAAGSITGNTLVSTITTGTAPLTVSSSTLVANLNADLLDGVDSLALLRSDVSDNFTFGTLTLDAGTTLSVLGSFSCTNCIGDTAVVDTITASNYLPLAGGAMTGALDMGNNLITNVGAAGTDFTASGGLTLAGTLDVNGGDGSDFAGGVTFNDDTDFVLGATENIYIDAGTTAHTDTTGVIDLEVASATPYARGLNIDFDWFGSSIVSFQAMKINLNMSSPATGASAAGLYIENVDTASNVWPKQLILLYNSETTGTIMPTGLSIQSAAQGITDGIDVSDGDITNALNVGSNIILMNDVSLADDSASANTIGLATGDNFTVINGAICVDNDGNCTSLTAGQVRADSFPTTGGDVAEMYYSDNALEPGDLVEIKSTTNDSVQATASNYSGDLVGVVSTEPGVILKGNSVYNDETQTTDPDYYPIALIGKTPVKVSTENGNISPGDPLTSSSTPGVAMKATESGPIVGKALESYSGPPAGGGVGKIMVFVNVGWYVEPLENTENTSAQVPGLNSLTIQTLFIGGSQISMNKSGALEIDGDVQIAGDLLVVGKIAAEELSLGDESSGIETIKAGSKKLEVKTKLARKNSKVFVTFSSDYSPATRYWITKDQGKSFTVHLDQPVAKSSEFSWLVVN